MKETRKSGERAQRSQKTTTWNKTSTNFKRWISFSSVTEKWLVCWGVMKSQVDGLAAAVMNVLCFVAAMWVTKSSRGKVAWRCFLGERGACCGSYHSAGVMWPGKRRLALIAGEIWIVCYEGCDACEITFCGVPVLAVLSHDAAHLTVDVFVVTMV